MVQFGAYLLVLSVDCVQIGAFGWVFAPMW